MLATVARTVRRTRHLAWRLADRTVRWACSPVDRRGRLVRVTLGTWVALYAAMSVLDFVRVGGPTGWVVVVPTAGAGLVAVALGAGGWHPRSGVVARVVSARAQRSRWRTGDAPAVGGLATAVDQHRVASATAPRALRRTQRAEVARLVAEVNAHLSAAHAVELVRVDGDGDRVEPIPGAEQAYEDLMAVVEHRVRRIQLLSAEALTAALDDRVAVAGHLDRVAVAARLSAQRQVDATDADRSTGAPPARRP